MGREPYESWNFAILADKDTILTKVRGKDDRYPVVPYHMDIPLPASVMQNQGRVTIRFVKTGENPEGALGSMPRLMEMKIIHE
jgi:hypothetical protein